MELISKDNINKWIVPFLSVGNRGKKPKVEQVAILRAILYKLKTGCQWRQLPTGVFFGKQLLCWQGVYYHFRKWVKDGSFRKVWVEHLKSQRKLFDLPECAVTW
ncbi:transposase [Adhaeribacter radiodurans]|uniref:Transposase n=1 Tax=Adhaeribacter radiodurans TaxID=2745197 RepID=A0A7L7L3P5_9BACT|nr:transposase [Adhaeribacter radiodurans]QMU27441.1 transposase [Adhaeribacter radiodurans]